MLTFLRLLLAAALERRHADIDTFIHAHGYTACARANVTVYLELVPHLRGSVLAVALPAPKIETMRPPNEVAAAIEGTLTHLSVSTPPGEESARDMHFIRLIRQ